MIKRLARWILRDELNIKIIPPSKVMLLLKRIFYHENGAAGMSYALAIRITDMYRKDYERCIATCQDIQNDLVEMETTEPKREGSDCE